ncbi:MAG: alpha/beta hydrolase [Burkholderiaceae bacterium]|nr:alpha/beta hydrolase [Burkholderiaceae bacterium]
MELVVEEERAYAYTGGRAFDPTLPVLVFIHGAQHDHSVWGLQTRYLAHHGFSVLAPDLPGHGRSAGAPRTTIDAMAGWILSLLAAARAPRAALIGHSMGSLVALEAAGRAPDSVSRLVLVATAAPMTVSDALLAAARDDEQAAFEMINLWSHSGITHRPGSPGPGFSPFVANLRLMQRQRPGVLHNDFSTCNSYTRALQRAAALRCPVQFILGGGDAMTPPKAARALIAACRDAQVVTIPGAGHNSMAERPDLVLDALRGFLSPLKVDT